MEMYMMKGNDVDDENDEYDVCVFVCECVCVCVCVCRFLSSRLHFMDRTVCPGGRHEACRMPFTRHHISGFLGANGEYFGHHWASLDSK